MAFDLTNPRHGRSGLATALIALLITWGLALSPGPARGQDQAGGEADAAKALPVFRDAITSMTVSDAIGIMQGADNAATQYFRSRTERSLRAQFLPIIQSTTSASGLTSSYKSLSDKIATYAPAYRSQLVDIDDYVLDRAMTALFDRID